MNEVFRKIMNRLASEPRHRSPACQDEHRVLLAACCSSMHVATPPMKPGGPSMRLRSCSHSYATSSVISSKPFAMGCPPAFQCLFRFHSNRRRLERWVPSSSCNPMSATAARSSISASPVHSPASCRARRISRSLGCIGRMSSIPAANPPGLLLGEPLLFKALAYLTFGPLGPHETVRDTMRSRMPEGRRIHHREFNLIPIGQLDGGHLLYGILLRRSYPVAQLMLSFAMAGRGLVRLLGLVADDPAPHVHGRASPADSERRYHRSALAATYSVANAVVRADRFHTGAIYVRHRVSVKGKECAEEERNEDG